MERITYFGKYTAFLGILLFCFITLVQCFKENITQPFEIRVVNIKNSSPVENAEITFVGQKLTTNSKGIASCQVNLDRFLLDRLVIAVDAENYLAYYDNVLIGKDQQETVVIQLTPENGLIYTPNPVLITVSETEGLLEITNFGTDDISCTLSVIDPWIILDTAKIVVSPNLPYPLRIRTNSAGLSCKKTGRFTINWRSTGKPDTVFVVKTFPDTEQPTAAFVLIPASTTIEQNTVFELDASGSQDNCSPEVPLEYKWSFANGTNFGDWKTSPKTTYFYVNPGVYTITLQVKDGGGLTNSHSVTVTVTEKPTPPVVATVVTAVDGSNLLSATLTGNLLSFGQTYNALLEWGFVWTDGTHDPTLQDNIIPLPLPAQLGNFDTLVQNLPPKKIRIRAFARNGTPPTAYSNTIEFTPKVVDFRLINPGCVGSFTAQRGTNNPNAPGNEKPSSTPQLNCFLISDTEVTNEQYAAYLTSAQSGENEILLASSGIEKIGTKYRAKPGQEKFPVAWVTWEGARKFCNWLDGGRLPTEAEWEAAARAGVQDQNWPVFSGTNNLEPVNHAVYNQPSPQPVKSKLPNQWGLYDMSGNVEEWCNDYWGPTHSPSTSNPQGPATGSQRVVRGGHHADPKERVTTTARLNALPIERTPNRGFRVVKSL